jgi:hypothetical protein
MIECLDYKLVNKGVLKGFAKIKIQKWGVIISSCGHFEKNGHQWISFPSNCVDGDDGKKKYYPYISFKDKNHMEIFSKEAVKAIRDFCFTNNIL